MEESDLNPAARITVEEMERRRGALEQADAHNRIEGIYRDPKTDDAFEAHIRGEIDLPEVLKRLKALSNRS